MTGKIARKSLLRVAAGLLIGAASLAWAPAGWGQGVSPGPQVEQGEPRVMDRSLPGKRTGVLTRAQNGIVSIDRTAYPLAADAVIQTKSGKPLEKKNLKLDDVQHHVDYWLGTDSADKQIVQLIIYFPE